MIRRYHICIRLDCDPNFSTEKTTKAFTGVEELTVEVFQAQYGSSDYKVLKLFEGVRGVKRVNIYGSVTLFPEYVEWLKTAMMAPKDGTVGEFEKEKPAATDGKSYDIWIVSRNDA
jgi:hypothetical protein